MKSRIQMAYEIVSDLISEVEGQESNKPIGEGITSEEYIKEKLYELIEILAGSKDRRKNNDY